MILQIVAMIMGILMIVMCGLNARTRRESRYNNLFTVLMLSLASIGVTSFEMLLPTWWSASILAHVTVAVCYGAVASYNKGKFKWLRSERITKTSNVLFRFFLPALVGLFCILIILEYTLWFVTLIITPLMLGTTIFFFDNVKDVLDEF